MELNTLFEEDPELHAQARAAKAVAALRPGGGDLATVTTLHVLRTAGRRSRRRMT